jgi:hypothetical protein
VVIGEVDGADLPIDLVDGAGAVRREEGGHDPAHHLGQRREGDVWRVGELDAEVADGEVGDGVRADRSEDDLRVGRVAGGAQRAAPVGGEGGAARLEDGDELHGHVPHLRVGLVLHQRAQRGDVPDVEHLQGVEPHLAGRVADGGADEVRRLVGLRGQALEGEDGHRPHLLVRLRQDDAAEHGDGGGGAAVGEEEERVPAREGLRVRVTGERDEDGVDLGAHLLDARAGAEEVGRGLAVVEDLADLHGEARRSRQFRRPVRGAGGEAQEGRRGRSPW